MKVLLAILFSLVACQSFSQNQKKIVVEGTVLDAESKAVLPWVNIVFKRKSIGTITGADGSFRLELMDFKNEDTLSFSFIGYQPLELSISHIIKQNRFELQPSVQQLNDFVVRPSKEFDVGQFMKEAILLYNKSKRSQPHIAKAHYWEKAKKDEKYIMYMESLGYSVYAGDLVNASPLSNYQFFCENTRAIVGQPEWMEYAQNIKGYNPERVLPASSSNLNIFRVLETQELLSPQAIGQFKFKEDSSYHLNKQLVLRIQFKGKGKSGLIDVFADNKEIIKIAYTTNSYFSTAFQKRVRAQISILFNYFNAAPFISKIESEYTFKGLTHWNTLEIVTQKFDDFELSKEEYWSFNSYATNPFVQYSPTPFFSNNITKDNDFDKIRADLALSNINMENQFKQFSGRWFIKQINLKTRESLEMAKDKIAILKNNF